MTAPERSWPIVHVTHPGGVVRPAELRQDLGGTRVLVVHQHSRRSGWIARSRITTAPAEQSLLDPRATGDPLVWIATRRAGIDIHRLTSIGLDTPEGDSTVCSRSTRTGVRLTPAEALDVVKGRPCVPCWTPEAPSA